MSRTIARYRDTGSVARRKGSGPKWGSKGSGRQMARELKISQRSMRRILQDVTILQDEPNKKCKISPLLKKKLDSKEPKSCFAWPKVVSCRIWFSPTKNHSLFSSLWTNKMIGFTCLRDYLKIGIFVWPPELKSRPWWWFEPP